MSSTSRVLSSASQPTGTFNTFDNDILKYQILPFLANDSQDSLSCSCKKNYKLLLFGERAKKREDLLFVHYYKEALEVLGISLPTYFLKLPDVLSNIKATSHEFFDTNDIISCRRLKSNEVLSCFKLQENFDGSFDLLNMKSLKPILRLLKIDGQLNKLNVTIFSNDERSNIFRIENGIKQNIHPAIHSMKDYVLRESDNTKFCDLIITADRRVLKGWKQTPDGITTCKLFTHSNGETLKNWKETPDGSFTCELYTYLNGRTLKGWKQSPDGTTTSELYTYPNGKTLKNWKQTSDNTTTCELFIFPDGRTFKGWKHTPDGTTTCELFTLPDGRTFKGWKQIPDGTTTCELFTLPDGRTFKGWKQTPDGTTTSELYTYPNGRTTLKSWKWALDGIKSRTTASTAEQSKTKDSQSKRPAKKQKLKK